MLSQMVTADVAMSDVAMPDVVMPERVRLNVGASLPSQVGSPAPRDRAPKTAAAGMAAAESAVCYLRPRVPGGIGLFGGSALAADQVKFALGQPTSQQYAHKTTRIAPNGGGAVGPHPARDPV
jgi:hypothetical protein